jgi:hypothetical protein
VLLIGDIGRDVLLGEGGRDVILAIDATAAET